MRSCTVTSSSSDPLLLLEVIHHLPLFPGYFKCEHVLCCCDTCATISGISCDGHLRHMNLLNVLCQSLPLEKLKQLRARQGRVLGACAKP